MKMCLPGVILILYQIPAKGIASGLEISLHVHYKTLPLCNPSNLIADKSTNVVQQCYFFSTYTVELEPEHLREERRCVLNSTQKLAFNNYMTFIQTAECTREVFKDVSHMTVT